MLRIIYAFDPLCGWCFGFAPALNALREARPDIAIELRLGGLVTSDRIGRYADMAGYIRSASARMATVTGVKLGEAFHDRILANSEVIASSLVPCDAILQVRKVFPQRVVTFAHAIQTAHFRDGEDLNSAGVYKAIAEKLELDVKLDLASPYDLNDDLALEFSKTLEMGITSYPTVMVQSGGDFRAIETVYEPKKFVDKIMSLITKAEL
jgi:putative protein-disulfide isomerase